MTDEKKTPEAEGAQPPQPTEERAAAQQPAAQPTTPEAAQTTAQQPAAQPAQPAAQPAAAQPTAQPANQQAMPPTYNPAAPQYGQQPIAAPAAGALDGKATAALVCGILALVLCGGIVTGIGLGIAAIILGSKVLKEVKDNSKAKIGRILGIIGLVLSLVMIAVFAAFLPLALDQTSGVNNAVNSKMDTLQNMSASDQKTLSNEIDKGFTSSSGLTLSQLGTTSDEFTSWMTSDISYDITGVDVKNNTATVTMNVKSRDFSSFLTSFENDVNAYAQSGDYSNLTSVDQVYAKVGSIMKEDMAKTGTTSHMETLSLTKTGNTWTVTNGSFAALEDDIFSLS